MYFYVKMTVGLCTLNLKKIHVNSNVPENSKLQAEIQKINCLNIDKNSTTAALNNL